MSWFGILQNEEENLESSQYRWRILVSSGAIPKSELKDSKMDSNCTKAKFRIQKNFQLVNSGNHPPQETTHNGRDP